MLSKKSHLAMININTMFFQPQRFPLAQFRDKNYWLCVTFCVMFSLLIYLFHTPTQDKLPTLYITLCCVFTFDLFIPRLLRLFFWLLLLIIHQKRRRMYIETLTSSPKLGLGPSSLIEQRNRWLPHKRVLSWPTIFCSFT